MTYENLRILKNILFRSFVVGIIIAAIFGAITVSYWPTWTSIATTWFHTDIATLTPIVLKFFMAIRFFLFFILLTPAIAIHWTLRREGEDMH